MSLKTVSDKLQIKANARVWLSDDAKLTLIAPLPDDATSAVTISEASVAIIFADDAVSLRQLLDAHKDDLTKPGILWVAYPKGNRVDINRDSLWAILSEYGMRPNSQIAIDDIWSALRFRALQDGEAPFTGGKS